jgi:hypothetical protein
MEERCVLYDDYYAYLTKIMFGDPEDYIDTTILSFDEYVKQYGIK